jgi:hypothetical protein
MKASSDKIIARLIDDDVDIILNGGCTSYLVDILRDGFCGYNKYSFKELKQELRERELEDKLDQ